MEKAMKFHICGSHICCDGKNKLNSHGFGFLEKGIDCTQVFAF